MPGKTPEEWKEVYRRGDEGHYPWELGKPRDFLVQLVEDGMIKGDRALDVCCGLGTNGLYLAEKGFDVTGMDISEKAVDIANQKAFKTNKGSNTRFVVQSFIDMDFEPASFDFALDIGCFHHVLEDDRQRFIENVHRVLRRGGRYLLMCFSDSMGREWNHFSDRQLRDLFSDYFDILTLKEVSSLEADDVIRQFRVSLMERRSSRIEDPN